jgi:hypothetical protein
VALAVSELDVHRLKALWCEGRQFNFEL